MREGGAPPEVPGRPHAGGPGRGGAPAPRPMLADLAQGGCNEPATSGLRHRDELASADRSASGPIHGPGRQPRRPGKSLQGMRWFGVAPSLHVHWAALHEGRHAVRKSRQSVRVVPGLLLVPALLLLAGCGQDGIPTAPIENRDTLDEQGVPAGSVQTSSVMDGIKPNRISPLAERSAMVVPERWIQPDRLIQPEAAQSCVQPLRWIQPDRIAPIEP